LGAADSEHIAELFAAFGPVTVRRMFSGAGIFANGLMLGLVVDGTIFLKADDRTISRFKHEGLAPFTYRTRGATRSLASYWHIPDRLYDDPDELAGWARQAMEAARRARASKAVPTKPQDPRGKGGKAASGRLRRPSSRRR
jgi:DNA transformation protein